MAKGKLMKSSKPSFMVGGKGHMFGPQHAGTGKSLSQAGTGKAAKSIGGKFMKGGSGHMFKQQHANPRKPGVTGK
jgi:hypothetical protein